MSATLCHISSQLEQQRLFCGFELHSVEGPQKESWLKIVNAHLHPNTRAGKTWVEDSWELFQDSGFLNLSGKSPEFFLPLKKQMGAAHRKMDNAPELACQSVWPSDRGIEASVSMLKLYQDSWLICQVAKRKGKDPGGASGREILRGIFRRAFEHAQQEDPNCDWVIGFTEAHIRWNRAMLVDVAEKFSAQGWGYTTPFHLMELSTRALPFPRDRRVQVAKANEDDRALFFESLEATTPEAYRESLNMTRQKFDLADIKQQWSGAGMGRERELWIAKRAGKAIGALVMECGEQGTTLFGLLDCVRWFPLAHGSQKSIEPLMEVARDWFSKRGRQKFLYVNENQAPEDAVQMGFQDLGAGFFIALSKHIIPDIVENIFQLSAAGDVPPIP